ncbi:glutathione S-transferase family protein [Sphingosinicella xenopeptidilytica]|uniref:Glutathione S-transferase family protein n=1 Tax=Sphingosinicella xenopeptidilytica TaxID=364098 RepID=A0ABW3C3U9_SPHXN
MKLYTNLYGPGPRRIFIYCKLKGITSIETNLVVPYKETREPEFLARNPAGKIPLLETEDGHYIFESQSILQYLETLYPEPPMVRTEEMKARRLDVQSGMINEFFYYLYISTLHTSPYVSKGQKQAYDADIVVNAYWRARLDQIDEIMAGNQYLVDDEVSIPDVMLYTMLEYIRHRFGIVIPPHLKRLNRWYERFSALPGVDPIALPDDYFDRSIPELGTRY